MNLSEISTPADLVKQNDISPAKDFVNQLDDLGPAEALAVAQMLVNKLHTLHCRMATRDDVCSPLAWAKDAGMLEVAMNILNNIDL